MRKVLSSTVVFFAGVMAVSAADYHWVGTAGDGLWVNPANWKENAVPGQYLADDGTTNGAAGDVAIFGAVADGAATTIDLKNQFLIKKVVITNGAPSYVFGADTRYYDGNSSDITTTTRQNTYQNLGIENGGQIVICEEVVNDQVFHRPSIDKGQSYSMTFYNHSPKAMFTYHNVNRVDGGSGTPYSGDHKLDGIGSFTFDGRVLFDQMSSLCHNGEGTLYIRDQSGTGARYSRTRIGDGSANFRKVHILPGGSIKGVGGGWPFTPFVEFNDDTYVTGEGVFRVPYPYNTPVEEADAAQPFYVNGKSHVVIDCGVVPRSDWMIARDFVISSPDNSTGSITFNSTNTLPGITRILSGATLCARMIGRKGCSANESSIALGDTITFEAYYSGETEIIDGTRHIKSITPTRKSTSKLKYTGPGGDTDRNFVVSNCYVQVRSTNTFANAGTGTFYLDSTISLTLANSAAFCLSAETAPLVFRGEFEEGKDWALQIKGDDVVSILNPQTAVSEVYIEGGTLDITSMDILPNATEFAFNSGKIRLSDTTKTHSLPLKFSAGSSEVELVSGVNIELDTLELASGAKVNFVVPEDGTSSIKVKNFEGDLPEGVTWNGLIAHYDENGNILPLRSQWKEAVDGSWSDSTKWDNGVPTATASAVVKASGASYTVSIDSPLTAPIKHLLVANETDGQTSQVLVNQSFTIDNVQLDVDAGGVLAVGENQNIVVGENVQFNLNSNGMFRSCNSSTTDVRCAINQDFGKYEISGAFIHTNKSLVYMKTGNVDIKDQGLVKFAHSSTLFLAPAQDGETAEMTMTDKAIYSIEQGFICVGNGGVNGRAVLNYKGEQNHEYHINANPYSLCVGYRDGYGEVNLESGNLVIGNHGVFIATEKKSNNEQREDEKASDVVGVFNISGGKCNCYAWGWHYMPSIQGFVVGNGLVAKSKNSKFDGTLNLTGGELEVNVGATVIGGGLAVGTVNQSGGKFTHKASGSEDKTIDGVVTTVYVHFPLVIGFEGGKGTYNLSGGTAKTTKTMFVGGAEEADLQYYQKFSNNYTASGGDGKLNISGGTFTSEATIFVGADGNGTIALEGNGLLETQNLVLSNNVTSTLKFTFNESSTGKLKVSGELAITDGAKLIVDLSAFKGTSTFLSLAEVASFDGRFADDAVEFIMPADYGSSLMPELVYSYNGNNGLWVKMPPKGTLLIIR